jgi:PAS domain S-box-containing protein
VHPDDRHTLAAAADSPDPLVEVEFRVLDQGGGTRWMTAHGLLSGDGEARERVGVVIDVTESRKRAEELRRTSETLQAVVAASPLPVTASDVDGRVTMWSPAAERMFGWTAEEALGERLPFIREEDWPVLDELRSRVLGGEVVVDLETVRRRKDGSTLVASLSLGPIIGTDGQVAGLVGILTDVTDRKRAEAEMADLLEREQKAREMLSAVVNASPVAIVAIDAERRVTTWNPAAERIFGWTAEEILSHPVPYIPPEAVHEADELWVRGFAGETVTDVQLTRLRKDGSHVEVEVSLAPLTNGEVYGLMALVADVSERARAERELREAEERYRTLVEQIPAIVYVDDLTDDGTMTTYVSPQVESTLGLTAEEWETSDVAAWLERMHPDDRERAELAYRRARELGEPLDLEYRFIRRDGEYGWFRDQGRVLPASEGRPAQLHGVMFDVTDLKRAEEELLQRNEELAALHETALRLIGQESAHAVLEEMVARGSTLLEASHAYLYELDPAGETLTATVTAGRAAQFAGMTITRDGLSGLVLETGRPQAIDDYLRWESRLREFDDAGFGPIAEVPLRAGNETLGVLGVARSEPRPFDRHDLALLERFAGLGSLVLTSARITDQLRASEERLRLAAETARLGIWEADLVTGEVQADRALETMFGFDSGTFGGTRDEVYARIHADDRNRVRTVERRALEEGEPYQVEFRVVTAAGATTWIHSAASIQQNDAGRPVRMLGVALDITELKRAELERRRLLSRLVAAQEEERRDIAADLHDDAIQAMTAVGLRLAALAGKVEHAREPVTRDDFDQLEASVRGALGRLRRLLFELRPSELDRGGLASALAIQLEQLRTDFGLEFRLENRLAAEPSQEARTIAYRIAQEALANARRHSGAAEVTVELVSRDEGVLVRVTDDGAGFSVAEALARPAPGHLGLAAMRERAELAGGWLLIESDKGAGTTVEFWIPGEPGDPTEGSAP